MSLLEGRLSLLATNETLLREYCVSVELFVSTTCSQFPTALILFFLLASVSYTACIDSTLASRAAYFLYSASLVFLGRLNLQHYP